MLRLGHKAFSAYVSSPNDNNDVYSPLTIADTVLRTSSGLAPFAPQQTLSGPQSAIYHTSLLL